MISGNPLNKLPEETEHCNSNSDREWTENRYLPRDEKTLIIMTNYIRYHRSYKKRNLKEHSKFNKKHVPTYLVPIIANCRMSSGVIETNEGFRKCQDCNLSGYL